MYDQVRFGETLDPRGRFKRPMDVVESTCIPADERFSILKAWEVDERALQRAEDEGWAAASMRICSASGRR